MMVSLVDRPKEPFIYLTEYLGLSDGLLKDLSFQEYYSLEIQKFFIYRYWNKNMKIIAHIIDDVCKEMKHMPLLEEIQIYFGSNKNKEDSVVNGDKTYFGSDPKEGHRSDMKSSFGIHKEA